MPDTPHAPTFRLLRGVLAFKILVTLTLWAGPLLLFPVSAFETLMGQAPEPINYARLLGVAYLALVVNYVGGYMLAKRRIAPWITIFTGLVSNGGGLAMLLYLSSASVHPTSTLTFISMGALTIITTGLAASAVHLRSTLSASPALA